MKYLLLFIFCFSGFLGLAQNNNTCKLKLKLVDQNNDPRAFTDFWLLDKETKLQMVDKTDQYGNAELFLKTNKSYTLNCNGAPDYIQIDVPEGSSLLERIIVLDIPNLASNPPDTIVIPNPPGRGPKDNEAVANQTWIDYSNVFVKNLTVTLYNRATNKVYVSVSDARGTTRFIVPEGKYLASVGLLHHYKETEIKKSTGIIITNLNTFVRTEIREKITNDTIVQDLEPTQEGTSESGLYILKLRDFERKPLEGEPVWVNLLGTKKVYQGYTDRYGMVKFLLPKGVQFDVSLKYSRSIDGYIFPVENISANYQNDHSYMGSKNIEKFYEDVKRTGDGFQTEFKSIPIGRIDNPANFVEMKPYGFNLNFKINSPCSAPVIAEDKIFVSGGYYSHHFFSFDTQTGKFVWGIDLAESGASPTVYMDGVLLINTQSCTLYAVEAATGSLLWSKWLGPNIYTTPTAANGLVYAVYPSTIQRYDMAAFGLNRYIVVAFDLQTGNIVWQKGIDNDVVAAPVAAPSGLYVTTNNGTLYRFDNKTGKQLGMMNLMAINQATIFDKTLAIATRSAETPDRVNICILDTGKFALIKRINLQTTTYGKESNGDAYQRMSFLDGRVVSMQGKNYSLMGGILSCFDSQTYQEIWNKKLGNNAGKSGCSIPVVLKTQLLVPTSNGKILTFDPKTGNSLKTFTTNYSFWSAPVVHKGWIYVSTIDGQIVSINTKDPKNFTGWSQWGMDASHNLLVK